MATSPAPESYQLAQAGLAQAVVEFIRKAFALLNPDDLARTVPQFRLAVEAIVQRYGQASVAAAWVNYRQARAASGVPGDAPRPPALQPIAKDAIDMIVSDAVDAMRAPNPDVERVLGDLDAEAEKLVLDHGRQATMDAVEADAHARGWARIPEPGACSFCVMLATRGAVYTRQSGDFQPHKHCRCHVQPVFTRYEPSAQVREWQALWARIAKEYGGGRDARVAFRQAIEGRPVTGPTVKPYHRK